MSEGTIIAAILAIVFWALNIKREADRARKREKRRRYWRNY